MLCAIERISDSGELRTFIMVLLEILEISERIMFVLNSYVLSSFPDMNIYCNF